MVIVTASNHFVPAFKYRFEPISISAGWPTQPLVRSQSGGLVAEDDGTPVYYLTVNFLWHSLNINALSFGLAAASIFALSSYLFRFLDPKIRWVRTCVRRPRVPTSSRSTNAISTLTIPSPQLATRAAYRRAHSTGQIAGWYFGSEEDAGNRSDPAPGL